MKTRTPFTRSNLTQKSGHIHRLFHKLFSSKLDEVPFIVLLSFLITFILARGYVYVTSHDILEFKYLLDQVYIRGVHVHHLNFGIVILSLVGYLALYDVRPIVHRRLAILYGIGLGLTFDEFALWLKLEDDYYARLSYDAIISISIILLNIAYFPRFWRKQGQNVTRTYNCFKNKILKR